MAREKGKKNIREALETLDQDLWHKLHVIWQKAEAGILEAQKSSLGHQQGPHHVRAVEENLSALIPDDWKGTRLSALELFLLSAAACLHDAGKAADLPGDHGHISMREICCRAQDFGLELSEAEAVGWLVHAHNDKKLDNLPDGTFCVTGTQEVYLRPMAALLCLADTLHCDRSRVSSQAITMLGPEAENHPVTLFRQLVRGWTIDERGHIEIQASAGKLSDIDLFHQGLARLCQEVEPITATLSASNYPCELTPGVSQRP